MATLHSDDFESGSLAAYTVLTDGAAVCAANATAVLAGTKGLQLKVVASSSYAQIRKTITPGSGILSLKYKCKIVTPTEGCELGYIMVTGGGNIVHLRMSPFNTRFEIWMDLRGGGQGSYPGPGVTGGLPATGTPFDLELVYNPVDVAHGNAPTATLYIDNVQTLQFVDPSGSGTPLVAGDFALGIYQHGDSSLPEVYCDDLLVSDAFVGAGAPTGQPAMSRGQGVPGMGRHRQLFGRGW